MTRSSLVKLTLAAIVAALGATAYVLACGPFLTDMRAVEAIRPGQMAPYAAGNLGVVREHFARRYLVQAFRRFEGRPALAAVGEAVAPDDALGEALRAWSDTHRTLTGSAAPIDSSSGTERMIGDFQWITNCLAGAFTSAAATGRARVAAYGAASAAVRNWVAAQDAVFSNCSGESLVLPEAAPAGADALTRADRAYQTAAAYFYAMRYDEAAARFREIAADSASPWRAYGHYLAGRALLRKATTATSLDRDALLAARAELQAAAADPAAASLKASTTGLLQLITLRVDPMQRLREVAAPLERGATATAAQLREYEHVMDRLLGDTTRLDPAALAARGDIAATSELNDWVMTMQATDEAAAEHAAAEWKRRGSAAWLVAALWKARPRDAGATALLDAAARLDAASPAFLTVSFLRARLLADRGDLDGARGVLASLPARATGRGDAEAVNLLNAMRFRVAASLDDLLAAAPRLVVNDRIDSWRAPLPEAEQSSSPLERKPVFDDDAGIVFSARLPLARLVEAAQSNRLPARLRLRVASAAFTRAWLLGRDEDALRVSVVLRALSPNLSADLLAFEAAPPSERHVAALRAILRTPGLRANVRGAEDDEDYQQRELARRFDHTFRRNWWCGFSETEPDAPSPDAGVLALVYGSAQAPYPLFLSDTERATVEAERVALAARGTAPNYLASEAVKWANARPTDVRAAEALAEAVEGTRWGCTDERTTAASRAAFTVLHKLFPSSEWAKKTRYWY